MQKKAESIEALLMCLESGVGNYERVGRGINNMNFLFINVSGFCCVLSMDNILCTVPYSDMAAVLIECTKEHSLWSISLWLWVGKTSDFLRTMKSVN